MFTKPQLVTIFETYGLLGASPAGVLADQVYANINDAIINGGTADFDIAGQITGFSGTTLYIMTGQPPTLLQPHPCRIVRFKPGRNLTDISQQNVPVLFNLDDFATLCTTAGISSPHTADCVDKFTTGLLNAYNLGNLIDFPETLSLIPSTSANDVVVKFTIVDGVLQRSVVHPFILTPHPQVFS